ncbi:MAG: hypothetical protein QXV13_02715, partial [Candidatus Micrarchaeaceae archaeon]
VQFPESTYQNYLTYNGNIANFEFFTGSGAIIPAWIESNSSGTITVWLKLANGIGPGSANAITVYLGFASPSTNLLSSSGTSGIGEAPQLSSTYAQYDDGASVFTNYWNFVGTSLPSGFSSLAYGGTYSVNNGLTLSVPATAFDYIHIFTTSQYAPSIIESYVSSTTNIGSGEYDIAYTTVETATGGDYGYQTAYRFDNYENNNRIIEDVAGSGSGLSTAYTAPSSFIISGFWPTTGNEFMQINYANQLSTTDSSIAYANSNLDLFVGTEFATAVSATTNWLRTRAYPPSGVMPSVSFGSVS